MKGPVIFPRAGITCADVMSCKGMSMARAARRLGLNRSYFSEVVALYRLQGLFSGRNRYRNKRAVCPDLGITEDDIISCKGMLQIDAAAELGMSADRLCSVLKDRPDLRRLFPARGGEARRIAEVGYAPM